MGISSSKKEVDHNNEFYLEAFGYKSIKVEGLDLGSETIKTKRKLETFNDINFEEEIIDHGDESGSVKPWLESVLAPNTLSK